MNIKFKAGKFSISAFLIIFFFSGLYADLSENSFWDNVFYYLYKPVTFILPHYETRKTLHETETQYFNIRVEESENGLRHLVFLPRKGSQSVYDTKAPDRITSKYIDYSLLAFPALTSKPENILFIGMGGGIMPMIVRRGFPDVNIDIVEIDREIPKIAEKYFGFKPDSRINIVIEDGRVYVNRCKKKYDVIFIDVYNADNIPFQFTTLEFYKQIKRILRKGGTCAVNVANMGKESFIKAELKTIMTVFNSTDIFVSPGESNYIPIMINDPINNTRLKERSIQFNLLKKFPVDFERCFDSRMTLDEIDAIKKSSALILTDDYAPINRLD